MIPRSLPRVLLLGCLLGASAALLVEVYRTAVGLNVRVVVPGLVYRTAQPSGVELEQLIRQLGIKTVINLRGCCPGFEFYEAEGRVTAALDIAQEDVRLSAGRMPSVPEARRLVEIFERTPYPVLIHCRRGADRTGLTSAIYLLLCSDLSFSDASRQLSLRFGHIALGRPAQLNRFLSSYQEWLRETANKHARAVFRRWLLDEYCPGECSCALTPLELPSTVPVDTPTAVKVRCRNTSKTTWQFRPGNTSGIHVVYQIFSPDGTLLEYQRAGLFDAVVEPGASIDVTLALPAIQRPGSYRLVVDMADEQHCWFTQVGSEPLETELLFQ